MREIHAAPMEERANHTEVFHQRAEETPNHTLGSFFKKITEFVNFVSCYLSLGKNQIG